MLSLTAMLQIEDRLVGIRQKDFSVFDRDIAVDDDHTPVCNLDTVQKTDGFCGREMECHACRQQVSVWRRQIPRSQMQFRVAGREKL
jgi:hypothetical protein